MVTKARSVSPGPSSLTRSNYSSHKKPYVKDYSSSKYGTSVSDVRNTRYDSNFRGSSGDYSSSFLEHARYGSYSIANRQPRSSMDRELYMPSTRQLRASVDRDLYPSAQSRSPGDRDLYTSSKSRSSVDRELYSSSRQSRSSVDRELYQPSRTSRASVERDIYSAATTSVYTPRSREPSVDRDYSSQYAVERELRRQRGVSVDRAGASSCLYNLRGTTSTTTTSSNNYLDGYFTRAELENKLLRTTPSSVSRFGDISIPRLSRYDRASSVSRNYSSRDYDYDVLSNYRSRSRASSLARYEDYENQYALRSDSSTTATSERATEYFTTGGDEDGHGNVKITILPSGKKAVCYSTFSQRGHGDQKQANAAIEDVIRRTSFMELTASALEDFVRKNRHLFPEDTTIYQKLTFYLLSAEELIAIGESPDAEIYGIKVKETLVVPYGTEITEILSRHLKRSDIDIEYKDSDNNRVIKQESYEPAENLNQDIQKRIRLQVEEEFASRNRARHRSEEPHEAHVAASRRREKDYYLDYKTSTRAAPRVQEKEDDYHYKTPRVQEKNDYKSPVRPSRHVEEKDDFKSPVRPSRHVEDKDNNYKSPVRPSRHVQEKDDYKPHERTTPHVRSTVHTGLDYESASMARSRHSSIGSDQESTYTSRSSVASSRRKKLDSAPQFTAKLRSKRVQEGSTVRFNCSVSGLPLPHASWFKGNNVVTQGGRISMTSHYGLVSLEISRVRREDAGLYTVKISNPEGEASSSAQLEVEEVEKDIERIDGTKRPYFTMEAQNTWGEVGQKACFEVKATGKPLPTFRWKRDNIVVSENVRCQMFSDENGNAKLVVKDLQHRDAGLYFCIAENKAGKAKCAATLRVVDHGQLTEGRRRSRSRETTPLARRSLSREVTPLQAEETSSQRSARVRGTKPWFIQKPPSEASVHEGESLTLKCIVDGDAKPRVTWYKHDKGVRELQYHKRIRVVAEGGRHEMEIRSAVQTDPGQYVVVAENQAGKVQASCWVNLLPRRVEEPEEYQVTRTRLAPAEYEYQVIKQTEENRIAPRFIKRLPLSKEVSPGDSLEMECRVKEAPHQDLVTGVEVKVKVKRDATLETLKYTEGVDGKLIKTVVSSEEISGETGEDVSLKPAVGVKAPPASPVTVQDDTAEPQKVAEEPVVVVEEPTVKAALPKIQEPEEAVQEDEQEPIAEDEVVDEPEQVAEPTPAESAAAEAVAEAITEEIMVEVQEAVKAVAPTSAVDEPVEETESVTVTVQVDDEQSAEPAPADAVTEEIESAAVKIQEADEQSAAVTVQIADEQSAQPSAALVDTVTEETDSATVTIQVADEQSAEPSAAPEKTDSATLTIQVADEQSAEPSAAPEDVATEETDSAAVTVQIADEQSAESSAALVDTVIEETDSATVTIQVADEQSAEPSAAPEETDSATVTVQVDAEQSVETALSGETAVDDTETTAVSIQIDDEQSVELSSEVNIVEAVQEVVETDKASVQEATKTQQEVEEEVTFELTSTAEAGMTVQETTSEQGVQEEVTLALTPSTETEISVQETTSEQEVQDEVTVVLTSTAEADSSVQESVSQQDVQDELSVVLDTTADSVGSTQEQEIQETITLEMSQAAESSSSMQTIQVGESATSVIIKEETVTIVQDDISESEEESGSEEGDSSGVEVDGPEFEETLQSQTITAGSVLKLTVKVKGISGAEVKWTKDDKQLKKGGAYEFSIQDNSYSLELRNTKTSDTGMYSCTISNQYGMASCSCHVTIRSQAESTPSSLEFVQPLQSVLVKEWEMAKFVCKVNASPKPEITWSKDGKTLRKRGGLKMSFEDEMYILVISSAQLSDAGQYSFKAENAAGSATCSATLNVIVAPQSDEESESEEESDADDEEEEEEEEEGSEEESSSEESSEEESSEEETEGDTAGDSEPTDVAAMQALLKEAMLPPLFVKELSDMAVKVGDAITVDCKLDGNPLAEVMWSRDGHE